MARSSGQVVDHIVLICDKSSLELAGFQMLRENRLESFAMGGDCPAKEKVCSDSKR